MAVAVARGADTYRRVQVDSRSPLELVVMLYDGALAHIGRGVEAIERRDLTTKREAVSRALAIVSELQSTLNVQEGGAIAVELERLYTYISERLVEGNTKGVVAPLQECHRLMTTLRDAWTAITSQATLPPAAP